MTEQIVNERYALEKLVGEGGMAVTYRARDLLLNRTVAIKIMREQLTANPQFVERFRREAQAAARLAHEHIAGVYDAGQAYGSYYIVMEYVEGTDLKQRLRRDGPLPVLTALEIAREIASALDAAHREGLVHRDVKPHNILLNADGRVKVTDFGIAKLASDGDDTGVIMGSVHYLSPEQARGEATTPSSDIYALGAVLFEMLTGRTMFEGENALAIAHKQVYEHPPMPRTVRQDIPPAVEAMVLRCLEKDPRARYQSAAEVQSVLRHLIANLHQDATVVLPSAVPSVDATVIYRKPAAAPVEQTAPPAPAPASPTPSRGGGGGAWIITLLFIALAAAVTYGAFRMFGDEWTRPTPNNGQQHQLVRVPDLTGLTLEQADALLQQRNLTGKSFQETSDEVKEGLVIRQDPAAEKEIDPKDQVLFWVSDGPQTIFVPDVTQMTLNAAKREIRVAGFKGEFAVLSEHAELPRGQVIRTEPATGATVDRESKMTLVLSKGAEQRLVSETYRPGAVPQTLAWDQVYVRVEFENPAGSEPQLMWEGTLHPGDAIPDQTFQRKPADRVTARTLYGKEAGAELDTLGEERFGGEADAPATSDAPSATN
jgi:serine/threonine-protein kinase